MKSFFGTPEKKEKYSLIIGDMICISGVLFLCFLMQLILKGNLAAFAGNIARLVLLTKVVAVINLVFAFVGFSLVFCLVYVPVFYITGLYEMDWLFSKKRMIVKLGAGVFIGMIIVIGLSNAGHQSIFMAEVWVFQFLSLFIVLFLWRYARSKTLSIKKPFRIIFTGQDILISRSTEYLNSPRLKKLFHMTSLSEDDFLRDDIPGSASVKQDYDLIVYPITKKLSQEYLVSLVKKKFQGYSVCSSLTFFKNIAGSYPVLEVNPQWLVDSSTSLALKSQFQQRIKRVLDILLSLVGLILSMPAMLVIAGLVKMTSPGPIFFVSERLGIYRRPFRLYKFRTMIADAERQSGPVWAQKDDPRVTLLGKFLRKTRLDELPQFYNILKGNMSFIGPRPIRQFFAEKLSREFPYYFLRFYVKPGLTGWAQVSGDYGATVDEQLKKLEYEMFYIHEYSLFLDALIILKTVQHVLRAKGQ